MTDIINIILGVREDNLSAILAAVNDGFRIDAFEPRKELRGKSLIDFLITYGKIREFSLEGLITYRAINPNQGGGTSGSLVNYCIEKQNIYCVRTLILSGATLTDHSRVLAANAPEIKAMLEYHPGVGGKTLFDFCSKRVINLNAVKNLILDYDDTTDGSDSEPESFKCDPIMLNAGERFAFRGIHFAPAYYSKPTKEKIKRDAKRNIQKTSYSQAILLDSGYDAGDEVSEESSAIKGKKREHELFFSRLRNSGDVKEKKIGSSLPPKSRNSTAFHSHFYRFIQVYINSYSRLFNNKAIQLDFGFSSHNNPLVSLSWSCEKASMYALGNRFDQGLRHIYKNPHYRRSTKKPKHPNAGYVDIFVFTDDYITDSTVDRKELFDNGLIYLNAFYRHEEEVIAFSLVPQKYHKKRCILSLPELDLDFKTHKKYYAMYGIKSQKTLGAISTLIFHQDSGPSHLKKYHEGLKDLTALAAEGQSQIISKKLRYG